MSLDIDRMLDEDDVRGLLRVTVQAERARMEGRYCECTSPEGSDYSPLCFACGLQNLSKIARLEAAMRGEPHPYFDGLEPGTCHRCDRPKTDPCHVGDDTP